jgi:hypothetical protein
MKKQLALALFISLYSGNVLSIQNKPVDGETLVKHVLQRIPNITTDELVKLWSST